MGTKSGEHGQHPARPDRPWLLIISAVPFILVKTTQQIWTFCQWLPEETWDVDRFERKRMSQDLLFDC